eukprot:scaffold50816_cov46-Attheya_sp.AAC.2
MDFNRLALSRDGHAQYDRTAARGQGERKNRKTPPRVTLEPLVANEDVMINGRQFRKIEAALWCKTEQDATRGWRPFLQAGTVPHAQTRFICISWLAIYCETARTVHLQYKDQVNEDGTIQLEASIQQFQVLRIQDQLRHGTNSKQQQLLQVYEIMQCLLVWAGTSMKLIRLGPWKDLDIGH